MDKRNEIVDSKTEGVKFKSRRRWKIKPDVVSEWKNAPFLEVFAREHRENWDVWGKEVPDTMQKILTI